MPTRLGAALIVLLWSATSGALIVSNVRAAFETRPPAAVRPRRQAVETASQWRIHFRNQTVGMVLTGSEPQADGFTRVHGDVRVDTDALAAGLEGKVLRVVSEAFFTPSGALRRVTLEAGLRESLGGGTVGRENVPLLQLRGTVQGNALTLHYRVAGAGTTEQTVSVPVDPYGGFTDGVSPDERLPGLAVGQEWTTTALNPLQNLVNVPLPGLGGNDRRPVTLHHRVTGTQLFAWDGRPHECFVVEHRHPRATVTSFVRARDGLVLRHEVPLLGEVLQLTLEPLRAASGMSRPL